MCFNSRYAGKIHRMKRITAAQIWGFNSRYAGKIHLAMHTPGNTSRVSIPAMRVRYISRDSITIRPTKEGFNSRYAGKIHHQEA